MAHKPTPDDEQRWIERSRRGDEEAMAKLYDAYHRRAFGAALLLTRDRTLAADAVQETFIKVFMALPRFRTGEPFRPWFFRILANESLRLLKRRRRFWFFREPPQEADAVPATPERIAMERERAEAVWKAVQNLPEAARTVVVLRYYLGLSEVEMAQVLKVPAGTVKSRLARARERLKETLAVALKEERLHA